MKIQEAFNFQLKPHATDKNQLRQFAGSCRFVWNKAIELENKTYSTTGKHLGYNTIAKQLKEWKNKYKFF